ncbi:MAG: nucleotidyltransferase family protein [Deltaproteobacteria bacterium]|nr:nucleotidyltransferase family protein [Deltaproteobacteria bacterium]
MSHSPIPLIVLGGRDRHTTVLPKQGEGKHLLKGYKAVDFRINDRPMIHLLVDRMKACGRFDPILIAGPKAIYDPLDTGAEVVDTDGDFGQNIRAGVEAAMARYPSQQIAVVTCDVLPEEAELRALLEDFESHQPCDFWMPQFRAPANADKLGASQWKPRYRIAPEEGLEPVETLPGHLLIVDPQATRLELVYFLFELSYRTRNRSILQRRAIIARHAMSALIKHDLRLLLAGELPTVTWDIVTNGLAIAKRLRSGRVSAPELARRVSRIYIHRRHRKAHPERQGRFPVLEGLSLAKDIDTAEEANEAARLLEQRGRKEVP